MNFKETLELNKLKSENARLREALERMVRAFNVKEIDPMIAFATVEKARAALANGG